MRAWFSGAFEHCLALCAAAHPRAAEARLELALVHARALLRLDRADEALTVLRDAGAIPCGADQSITLRMLSGAAYVRRGDLDRGLELLLAAQIDGAAAHRTIRSELALNVALAHYGRRDFDAAERALHLVEPDADIVYARALEYFGWVASARVDGERATAMFVDALGALDRCRHYDRFLEANCIRALAHLAVERLDRKTWAIVEERRAKMDWSADGLAQPRFWIAYCAATFSSEVQGNALNAAREARTAESAAPTAAFRVQARCKRAAIARCAGESISQRDHAESAADVYAALNPSEFTGDEPIVSLVLAEELASLGCTDEARSAVSTFLKFSRTSAMLSMTHSPATYAYQRLVEGAVLESAGERRAAIRRYTEAFDLYVKFGYKRRAVCAALRLARLSPAPGPIAYADAHTRRLSAQSWLRREVQSANQRTLRLTTVQREVLALICRGTSNPDIAAARKRSVHTVRNLVARLFVIFAVSSREELAVECVRRGLYTPK
ncbi:MAG: Bacterial regulatory protein luxR family [Candidatus Eremiobacteraeota bacterium]|nr:Bacterial regulatory protein luxR family [Candidatus Eremiobacteraeota bacterium]